MVDISGLDWTPSHAWQLTGSADLRWPWPTQLRHLGQVGSTCHPLATYPGHIVMAKAEVLE